LPLDQKATFASTIFAPKAVTVLEDLEASIDLRGTRENAPNIQIVTGAVDPVKRCVYYTRDNEGHQVFKIRVYVTGPDIQKIKSVKYSLHQIFEKPEHISTDASQNFEMIMWSWGRFVMPIIVTTMNGNEYVVHVSFYLPLSIGGCPEKRYPVHRCDKLMGCHRGILMF
jgi:hypothetical protein